MNSGIKVLLIDDDKLLGTILTLNIKEYGYDVNCRYSLDKIDIIIADFKPNIIVLDVEIGDADGIETAPYIQSLAPDTPILFISSHFESSFAVRAVNAGGATYLRKPFETEELIAYIKKYTKPPVLTTVKVGVFELNIEDNTLRKGGEVVKKLALNECLLLHLFITDKNHTITREKITAMLWPNDSMNHDYSLNNYITKLRKVLLEDKNLEIQTVHQLGYKLLETV
ncbi:MAG: response regulator transcription factor [Bacteroidales bacterium]